MTSWNDRSAIWRDLSLAQGREVPAELDSVVTLAHNERPPQLCVTEEIEDEFLKNMIGDDDCNIKPDLVSISTLLKQVNHYTHNTRIEDSDCPSSYTQNSNMFKKKTKNSVNSENCETLANKEVTSTDGAPGRQYVPSARAEQYYRSYGEQRRARQPAAEDVWSRAERQMRELDEQRRQRASGASSPAAYGMAVVGLSDHRHMTSDPEECVVCQVVKKRFSNDSEHKK